MGFNSAFKVLNSVGGRLILITVTLAPGYIKRMVIRSRLDE